jgi:hypothetical protein
MIGRPRTRFFDQRFFDVIDTEARAYWLGMLMADGWVPNRKSPASRDVAEAEDHATRVGVAGTVMTKPLTQGVRVCKEQQFGTVDAIVERWIGSTLILRIIVVQWDNGDVSDEDEDGLDTVVGPMDKKVVGE